MTKKITSIYYQLYNENQPEEVVMVVPSGHSNNGEQLYYVFKEDAYQLEPYFSGITPMTAETIRIQYGINLAETVDQEMISGHGGC